MNLEISGELRAREAGFAFHLDFVESENRILGGSYQELAGGNVQLIGLES